MIRKIEAVIRPEKLEDVLQALKACGSPGVMISEITGHGRQQGIELEWRVGTYKVDRLPKVKIEIVVSAEEVQCLVDAISEHGLTGVVGDGKIFVLPVETVTRIRTKETGLLAL